MGIIIKFEDHEGGKFLNVNTDCLDLVIVEIEQSSGHSNVTLDIETAVKFSKELRRQIALAKTEQELQKIINDGE